jgi:hypothetical protein
MMFNCAQIRPHPECAREHDVKCVHMHMYTHVPELAETLTGSDFCFRADIVTWLKDIGASMKEVNKH